VLGLTGGNINDTVMFPQLMAAVSVARSGPGRPRTRPDYVLGDKGYSSRRNRALLRRRGISHTIPEPRDQQANRRRRGSRGGRPVGFDKVRYKQRNVVERGFGQLKQRRGLASRYDKHARSAASTRVGSRWGWGGLQLSVVCRCSGSAGCAGVVAGSGQGAARVDQLVTKTRKDNGAAADDLTVPRRHSNITDPGGPPTRTDGDWHASPCTTRPSTPSTAWSRRCQRRPPHRRTRGATPPRPLDPAEPAQPGTRPDRVGGRRTEPNVTEPLPTATTSWSRP
jgi:transposase